MLAYPFENGALHPIKRKETTCGTLYFQAPVKKHLWLSPAYRASSLRNKLGIAPRELIPQQRGGRHRSLKIQPNARLGSAPDRSSGNVGGLRVANVSWCGGMVGAHLPAWLGGGGDLGEMPPLYNAVDFGRVVFSLAGIERKNKLNSTPVIWKKHFNNKIASCWYQVAGGFQGNELEVFSSSWREVCNM